MRIEKVNDTQIRCTLTKEDLAERQIKLSELAYGSEKAKTLFRDMMQQAATEFGFEADNIPLMIEAIPLSTDAIILIITKVEYPEELDTRFSQFSPASADDESENENLVPTPPMLEGAEDIMKLLNKLKEKSKEISDRIAEPLKEDSPKAEPSTEASAPTPLTKLYVLDSMDTAMKIASIVSQIYTGENELYHNKKDSKYYLFLHSNSLSTAEFNKTCNILSEYAKQEHLSVATEAFFKEHYECILPSFALQTLNNL